MFLFLCWSLMPIIIINGEQEYYTQRVAFGGFGANFNSIFSSANEKHVYEYISKKPSNLPT